MQGIDLLRGLCIVAVVLHHTNLRIPFNQSATGKLLSRAALRVLFWSGAYGVTVFFVISGFLITTWSLKRWGKLRDVSCRQFYAMRFARIVPCLLGLLVVLSLLDLLGVPKFTINPQHTSLPRALLAALTFHINWLEAKTGYLPGAWDVLWSLSVEEMFYFFFPLLCWWTRRSAVLVSMLGAFVIAGPFARTFTHNQLWSEYGYLSCMDGIALGCLAALLAATVKFSNKANLALRVSGAAVCVFVICFRVTVSGMGLYKTGLDATLLELGAALLVIGLQQRFEQAGALPNEGLLKKAAFIGTAWLRWFGRNSYEVYLTHMLVVWPMVAAFYRSHQPIDRAPLWFLTTAAVSGVAGYLVERYYSAPLNHGLRRKLLPSHVKAAGA